MLKCQFQIMVVSNIVHGSLSTVVKFIFILFLFFNFILFIFGHATRHAES